MSGPSVPSATTAVPASVALSLSDIVEKEAMEASTQRIVTLRMTNLRLHSSGVFSNVYRGTLLSPGEPRQIAIKKTWPQHPEKNFETVFLTGLSREQHPNIMSMLYLFRNQPPADEMMCLSFVFEFMPDTLGAILREGRLHPQEVKLFTFQLFNGLRYLALVNKPGNKENPESSTVSHIAISSRPICWWIAKQVRSKEQEESLKGLLKIGDFGSAKLIVNHKVVSTTYQVTRHYRPPELLLGSTTYRHTVDLWSAGCVFGEMIAGQVLFPGRDEKDQHRLIWTALGTPTESDLLAMHSPTKLIGQPIKGGGFKTLVSEASKEEVRLLEQILVYKPKLRLGGRKLLLDPFFDDLFKEGALRPNGSPVSKVLTRQMLDEIRRSSDGRFLFADLMLRLQTPLPILMPTVPTTVSEKTAQPPTSEKGVTS